MRRSSLAVAAGLPFLIAASHPSKRGGANPDLARAQELAKAGQWDDAVAAYQSAVDAAPGDAGLAHQAAIAACNAADGHIKSGDVDGGMVFAIQATSWQDSLACGHLVKGELLLDGGQSGEAVVELEKAKRLDPKIKGLDDLLKRARGEFHAVADDKGSSAHFTGQLIGNAAPGTLSRALQAMESARSRVQGSLGAAIASRIVVQVYCGSAYAEKAQAPEWSDGYYDGKIRVMLGDEDPDGMGMTDRMSHEYSHAVVRWITHSKAPAWLDEGLAMHAESNLHTEASTALLLAKGSGRIKSLASLEQTFSGMSDDNAKAAYAEAFVAVTKLQQRFGNDKVLVFLKKIGDGAGTAKSFQAAFGQPFDRFDKDFTSSI